MPQLFYIVSMGIDENSFEGSSASEQRTKVFSWQETMFLKRKKVNPLNAKRTRQVHTLTIIMRSIKSLCKSLNTND